MTAYCTRCGSAYEVSETEQAIDENLDVDPICSLCLIT